MQPRSLTHIWRSILSVVVLATSIVAVVIAEPAQGLNAARGSAIVTSVAVGAHPHDADTQFGQVRVVDRNGTPLSGTMVRVEVIPRTLDTWGPNPWPLAGVGTIDGNGHVIVTLNEPAAGTTALRSPDGVVNYELYLVSPAGVPIPLLVLPRYYGADARRAQEFIDVAAPYSNVQLSVAASHVLHDLVPITSGSFARGSMLHGIAPHGCYPPYWSTVSTSDAWTVVGELHTEGWVNDARFTYGSTADSNIEVAISNDGGGTWSDNGTLHVSNNIGSATTQDEYSANWGHQLQAYMHYQKQRYYWCNTPTNTYQVVPTSWNGGGFVVGSDVSSWDGKVNQPNSVYLGTNQSYTRNANSAYSYGGAVSVFGVSLHAESGYSTNVQLYWQTAGGSFDWGCLYGNDGPPATATIIYVGPYGCPGSPFAPAKT